MFHICVFSSPSFDILTTVRAKKMWVCFTVVFQPVQLSPPLSSSLTHKANSLLFHQVQFDVSLASLSFQNNMILPIWSLLQQNSNPWEVTINFGECRSTARGSEIKFKICQPYLAFDDSSVLSPVMYFCSSMIDHIKLNHGTWNMFLGFFFFLAKNCIQQYISLLCRKSMI